MGLRGAEESQDDEAEETETEEEERGECSLSRKRKKAPSRPNPKAPSSGSTRKKKGKTEGQASTSRRKRKSLHEDAVEIPDLLRRPRDLTLEPMEEMEMSEEDKLILDGDVPERMQEFWRSLDASPEDEDVSKEAEWIYRKLSGSAVLEQEKATVQKQIEAVLCLMHREKLEIPFIGCYRKEGCPDFIDKDGYTDGDFDDPATKPKLQQFKDLWEVHFWDRKWLLLQKRKRELQETVRKKRGAAPEQEKALLWELSTFLADVETEQAVEDVNAKLRFHFAVDAPEQSFKRPRRRPVNAVDQGLDKLVESFGLSSTKLSENLRFVKIHEVEDPPAEPKQIASSYVGASYKTEESVLEAGRHIASLKICLEPSIRAFVRDLYSDKCSVTTRPTLKGASAINEHHPYAKVLWLTEKPVSKFEDAQWLLIEKAEHEGLVEAAFQLPKDVDLLLTFEAAYLSNADASTGALWNEERKKVIEEAVRTVAGAIEKELRSSLAAKGRRWIASKYAEQLWEMVSLAPYSRRDTEDYSNTRVLACCWDAGRHEATCVMLDADSEIDDVFRAGYLGNRAYSDEQQRRQSEATTRLMQFIVKYKPDVCVVGASSIQSCRLLELIRKAIEDITEVDPEGLPPGGVEVVHGNETVAGLYGSKLALRDQSDLVPRAVALGRILLDPLAAISALCGPEKEILSLKLHPLQDHLSPAELYEAVEQVMVTVTAQVGVDVNLAAVRAWLFGPLQFVPGLGHRKAFTVRRAIHATGKLNYRSELRSWKLMKQSVYTNCAGSMRVRRTGQILHEVMDSLDETRIHPESYTTATELAQYALTKESDQVHDLVLQTAIDYVRSNSSVLKDINVEEYLKTCQEKGFQHGVETLRDIKFSLMRGSVEVRKKYEAPNNEQVVLWMTGEFSNRVTVTVQEITKRGIMCILGSGERGLLQVEEGECYAQGTSLPCIVGDINTEFMRLELGPLPEEEVERDEFYKVDETYISNLKQRAPDKVQVGVYKEREIEHPQFRNVSTASAAEELAKGESGSFIFIPSTKGPCFLSLLLKIADGVNLQTDIWEGQKDAENPRDILRLGKVLKIQGEAFKDLDEVVARFVDPLVNNLRNILTYRKFKSGTQEEVDEWLRTEKAEKPSHIPYCLCVCQDRPGDFTLSYVRSATDPSHEYLAVTSRGYKFKNRLFESPERVIGYFQQHIDDVVETPKPFIPGASCYTCGEDGHMSRDCPSRRGGGGGGGRACRSCGNEGHIARDCPNKADGEGGGGRACHSCGDEGHISRDCPNKSSKMTCRSCGEEGHMSRECPNKPDGGGGGRACHSCGQEGHLSRDCPSKPARTCRSCGEEGHIARECSKTDNNTGTQENADGGNGWGDGGGGFDSSGWGDNSGDAAAAAANNQDTGWGDAAAGDNQNTGWGDDAPASNGSGWGQDVGVKSQDNTQTDWGATDGTKSTRAGGSCFSCGQEGHMSRDCPNKAARQGGGGGACFNCGEEGHRSRDCPAKTSGGRKPVSCYACQGEGHISRDCPNKKDNERGETNNQNGNGGWGDAELNQQTIADDGGDKGQTNTDGWGGTADGWGGQNQGAGTANENAWPTPSRGGRTGGKGACYTCGEEGHLSRDCPSKPPRKPRACYSCGDEGHISRDCPSKNKPEPQDTTHGAADTTSGWGDDNAGKDSGVNTGGWGEENQEKETVGDGSGEGNAGDGWGEDNQTKDTGNGWGEGNNQNDGNNNAGGEGAADTGGFNTSRKGGGACFNCGQEGHMSRQCPNKSTRRCYSCGQEGHTSRDCPDKKPGPCHSCGETGHLSRDCVAKISSGEQDGPSQEKTDANADGAPDNSTEKSYYGSGRGSGRNTGSCFSCGEEGHMSRDCPKKPPRTNVWCYSCGKQGHVSRECPTKGCCYKCGQKGHSFRNCPGSTDAPPAAEADKVTEAETSDGVKECQVEEAGDSLPEFIPLT